MPACGRELRIRSRAANGNVRRNRVSISAMRLICLGLLLATGCATAARPTIDPASSDVIRPSQGPYATRVTPPTAEPPEVWLDAERDVILQGQVPSVYVDAGDHGVGQYRDTGEFTLVQPDGNPAPRECDEARRPPSSRGFAALSFECRSVSQLGVYAIGVEPSRLGLNGQMASLRIRVLPQLPPQRPAPGKWKAVSLAARMPPFPCAGYGESYSVSAKGMDARIVSRGRGAPEPARLPVDLAPRLSPAHAAVVRYVFEANDGWIVLFDHGEFGGGAEWFARAGGAPRSIVVGPSDDENSVPQNVNRALASGGDLYVLQGLSHMGMSTGQFAKIWREHDHFTSHVIARYASEPFDWIREPDGAWLIATWRAIWRTTEGGRMELLARLPSVVEYPNSIARTDDGTLYVGGRGGVLRLTPTWPDEPRYAADFLIPPEREANCLPEGE